MYQYALAANSERNIMRKSEEFMDGLASQLEKFLYDIQSEPGTCAFQSTTVNAGTPGSKLGVLRALLEREADKLRGGEPAVKFAGNYNEHGLVA